MLQLTLATPPTHHEYEYSAIIDEWEAGRVTNKQALAQVFVWYQDADNHYQRYALVREQLRGVLARLVERFGGHAMHAGYTLRQTECHTRRSYDTKALDALILDLMNQGQVALAQRIAATYRETMVAGALRIDKEKQ